jgi:hypothetical protein
MDVCVCRRAADLVGDDRVARTVLATHSYIAVL